MGDSKYGPAYSHEARTVKRMHLIYSHKMQERQFFMEDLKLYRAKNDKRLMRQIVRSIGPPWYQALSVPQRLALDTLEISIYKDILEGRPRNTFKVMKQLGIFPRPNLSELMYSIEAGREDPKAMLAHLFLTNYGHAIDGKRYSYDLNAKLMLSAILYLGLDKLIQMITELFRPPPCIPTTKSRVPKKIEPPLESPYHQKLVAYLYLPPRRKPFQPAPLPNMEELLESLAAKGEFDEEFTVGRPPPPPPPPPPPKKKIPKSLCDKLADIQRIYPYSSPTHLPVKPSYQHNRSSKLKRGSSRTALHSGQNTFGIGCKPPKARRKKPTAPNTGMWNTQYMIMGVYTVLGKTAYVLGNVNILPSSGELIHGGYRAYNGDFVNIHCGIRVDPPPPPPKPCDCLKKWTDTVFDFLKKTKCSCGHHYDYGHEGNFPPDEVPYFQKPTRYSPFSFNYNTIYNLDPKSDIMEKEFKKFWDTDSVLGIEGLKNKKKDKKKKKSNTCIGDKVKPEDYLRCVLRFMKRENLAARLPDVHLTPELKEWMRRRVYGPYNKAAKVDMKYNSNVVWTHFRTLDANAYGHVPVPPNEEFTKLTNWRNKQVLNDKFRRFTEKYRLHLFRSHAKIANLLWPSMYQAELPDKHFREIYFSYLSAKIEDFTIIHPYSSREAIDRQLTFSKKPYCCNNGIEVRE